MQKIYLDNSATTKLSTTVKKAMTKAMESFGNASSLHQEGRKSRQIIETARRQVADLLNAELDEIIFTSGGSESNNTIINIAKEIASNSNKNEIIISAIEHHSLIIPANKLNSSDIKVHYLPINDQGGVIISELEKIISKKTALVSIALANNEIGVIQDLEKISIICKKNGALLHSDIVQAVGKINVDVKKLNLDYASISAHKINGPKGVGALYVKSGATFVPLITGGHQESNKRSGTENIIGIAGFGQAALDAKNTPEKYNSKILPLKNMLRDLIEIDISNIKINGDQENSLPNILNVSFFGAEGESILLMLDHHGISVSTGSACASDSTKPSHVLMAIKSDPELAHGSIRFSFGLENTIEEVFEVIKCLPGIIEKLRKISTRRSDLHG